MIEQAMQSFYEINMGGTAVGTGFEAPKNYDKYCIAYLNQILKTNKYEVTPNKYHGT